VLVTGAAGYIGSVLCGTLLEAGFEVRALDNLTFGGQSLLALCDRPGFDFVYGDVRNERLMAELVEQADVIIPLAAVVGAPACDRDPDTARAVNLEAIKTLARLRKRDQLVVFPTTNSGYGTTGSEAYCTEDSPMKPISLYGTTKVEAEKTLLEAGGTITLRLATVFGASPRPRIDLLVNHFTYAAFTDGYVVIFEKDFKRNFVHIRDVADGFVFAINNADRMVGQPYNLGLDSANMSKGELALKVKEHVPNFYIHFAEVGSDPDKRDYIVSSQRLRDAGFEAHRSLDQGIKELLLGYRLLAKDAFANA
jgi:nucleoside-diphosphate-sugar epimerase